MKDHTISQKDQHEGVLTSGAHHSYWIDSVEPIKFSPLTQDQKTEIVIVGGGIAGLSVAYCLIKAGKKVMVVEDGFIGSGETGRTTAHLVNALDDRYSQIERILGEEKCRVAAESHTKAIDFIEQVVREEKIDCDFRRVDGFLFLHPSDEQKTIEEEFKITNKYGIKTEKLLGVPGISTEKGNCLKFPAQAQFHPLKYLRGVCDCIVRMGGLIFTETHIKEISKTGIQSKDFSIQADHVVVATNSPINNLFTMHTKQFPYRTYVIGGLIPKGTLQPCLWWDTGNLKSKWMNDPYHYARTQTFDEAHDLIIIGGEDHRTGQADHENIEEGNRYKKLEVWARKRFPMMKEIVYQWSGQVMEPVDMLAFIGHNPGDKNIYIATGDSGNGMTYGSIAGMLITDLILGKENPWEKVYSPSRITLKATGDFLKAAVNMGAQYLDFFEAGDIKSLNELKPSQGAIFNMKGKKVAVYKDSSQELHAYSAICPHLGCVLQWNADENSFDCPCHGSRFTCEGSVVNGPAMNDLKKIELK